MGRGLYTAKETTSTTKNLILIAFLMQDFYFTSFNKSLWLFHIRKYPKIPCYFHFVSINSLIFIFVKYTINKYPFRCLITETVKYMNENRFIENLATSKYSMW